MEQTGPRIFQAIAVKHGLKACSIGRRVNSAYTAANCFATASEFTGVIYKRGQYDEAIRDLDNWIEEARKVAG